MDRKKFGSLLLVKKNGSLKKLLWWSLAWFIYFYLGCPWPYCVTRPFHFIINTDFKKDFHKLHTYEIANSCFTARFNHPFFQPDLETLVHGLPADL